MFVVGGGVDAVGEQDDEELFFRVDPDGGAGEAGVAEGAGGQVTPASGRLRGRVPAQGAAAPPTPPTPRALPSCLPPGRGPRRPSASSWGGATRSRQAAGGLNTVERRP